jgi:hypothetical protein
MYILSKYKDYYDYLTGIYGVDKKLILDRRNTDSCHIYNKITLYIAGYVIEGIYFNNKFYYGEDLRKYIVDKSNINQWWKKWKWLSRHVLRDYDKSYHIKFKDVEDWFYLEPIKDKKDINQKYNCPIIIKNSFNNYCKYPKLEDLGLASFIPAETIYQWLSEWLSNQITSKEKQIKEIPDSLKIENKGFDKKRSFRPKIKK